MNKFHVLVVDDDPDVFELFEDTLERLELEDKIFLSHVESKEEAEKFIQNNPPIDAAIMDLRLGNSAVDNQSQAGNETIKMIKSLFRCPIIVSSGFANDLDEDLKKEHNIFFRIIPKTEAAETLTHIHSICATGITQIINRKGSIDKILQNVFQTHLPISMDYWIAKSKDNNIESALSRYVLSHLQEHLEMAEAKLDAYHHTEMYIKPIIKQLESTVFTGDILKYIEREEYYYVITPLCDLVSKSIGDITLIKIEKEASLPNISGSLGLIKKNNQAKYHYLHPVDNIFSGGALNFQKVIHVPILDIKGENPKFSIECSVTQAFKKDITARFANYYARQGQPGFI